MDKMLDFVLDVTLFLLFAVVFIFELWFIYYLMGIQGSNQMLLHFNTLNGDVIEGVYSGGDFYCVNARQKVGDVLTTEIHEECHYMVNEEFRHFCKGE